MPVRISVAANVVRVDWEGAATDEELPRFFEDLSAALEGLDRYAIVYCLRSAAVPTWSQRQLIADLNRTKGPALRDRCAGVAFVIDSVIIRAGLAALFWLQPMSVPNTIVETLEEAEAFCRERLRPVA